MFTKAERSSKVLAPSYLWAVPLTILERRDQPGEIKGGKRSETAETIASKRTARMKAYRTKEGKDEISSWAAMASSAIALT